MALFLKTRECYCHLVCRSQDHNKCPELCRTAAHTGQYPVAEEPCKGWLTSMIWCVTVNQISPKRRIIVHQKSWVYSFNLPNSNTYDRLTEAIWSFLGSEREQGHSYFWMVFHYLGLILLHCRVVSTLIEIIHECQWVLSLSCWHWFNHLLNGLRVTRCGHSPC